jgi:hypothetical protein
MRDRRRRGLVVLMCAFIVACSSDDTENDAEPADGGNADVDADASLSDGSTDSTTDVTA